MGAGSSRSAGEHTSRYGMLTAEDELLAAWSCGGGGER